MQDSDIVSLLLFGDQVGVLLMLWLCDFINWCELVVMFCMQMLELLFLKDMQVILWLFGDYVGDSRDLCECVIICGLQLFELVMISEQVVLLFRLIVVMYVMWVQKVLCMLVIFLQIWLVIWCVMLCRLLVGVVSDCVSRFCCLLMFYSLYLILNMLLLVLLMWLMVMQFCLSNCQVGNLMFVFLDGNLMILFFVSEWNLFEWLKLLCIMLVMLVGSGVLLFCVNGIIVIGVVVLMLLMMLMLSDWVLVGGVSYVLSSRIVRVSSRFGLCMGLIIVV